MFFGGGSKNRSFLKGFFRGSRLDELARHFLEWRNGFSRREQIG
ncbi:hypothetical protein HMPREF1508_1447 [Shuttleworthella sp. MSX8B]|nr:hypothetical protein HMPREF1508_1447 [Shuttleworthia sp. MSX8B]